MNRAVFKIVCLVSLLTHIKESKLTIKRRKSGLQGQYLSGVRDLNLALLKGKKALSLVMDICAD